LKGGELQKVLLYSFEKKKKGGGAGLESVITDFDIISRLASASSRYLDGFCVKQKETSQNKEKTSVNIRSK